MYKRQENVRRKAVRQIASGWKQEPGILELLKQRVVSDESEYVRQTALEAIVKQYPDHPQTLPLLQDRAENDPDEQLQNWARRILQQYTT